MRSLSLSYALVLLSYIGVSHSIHSQKPEFQEKTDNRRLFLLSEHHRRLFLVENPVTYGQLYSHLSNIYGRLACSSSLSVSGSALIVEQLLFCRDDVTNVTLRGQVKGKDLYITSLEECSGLDQVPLCTEILFDQEGSNVANCTADYGGESCDCDICKVDESSRQDYQLLKKC